MKKFIAELMGTFVLVFGGVGSAVLAGDKIGYTGISLAFGLSLLAMVYTIGPISGCHINPAVTFGALLSKKIDIRNATTYFVAQVAGALQALTEKSPRERGLAVDSGREPGCAGRNGRQTRSSHCSGEAPFRSRPAQNRFRHLASLEQFAREFARLRCGQTTRGFVAQAGFARGRFRRHRPPDR